MRDGQIVAAHAVGGDLDFAGALQGPVDHKGLRNAAAGDQQAVVAQDQDRFRAQALHQPRLLAGVGRDALEVVVCDLAIESCTVKVVVAQPFLLGRHRAPRGGMRVDDAVRVIARGVEGAVDYEARNVHRVPGTIHRLSGQVDLDQVGGGDLVVIEAVGIDEVAPFGADHPRGDVVVDGLGPSQPVERAVQRGQFEPCLPFPGAHRGGLQLNQFLVQVHARLLALQSIAVSGCAAAAPRRCRC